MNVARQPLTSTNNPPIIGASKPGHLEDAIKALSVKLDEGEVKFLSELYKPRGILANM